MSPNKNSRLIWCAEPTLVSEMNKEPTAVTSKNDKSVNTDNQSAKGLQRQESSIDLSAQDSSTSTVLNQRLPSAKSRKSIDWSLILDNDIIVKEEIMTDQDDPEEGSSDPNTLELKKNLKQETKEGIRMQVEIDRLAAEHGSGEVKRQTDPCLQTKKKNGKRKRKEEASAQNRSEFSGGASDCDDYSLFMSPAGTSSSCESADEEDRVIKEIKTQERTNILVRKTSSLKAESNVASSASFASTFVPTSCPEQQDTSTVFRTKAYSDNNLTAPSILINLPQIKKEVKTSQMSAEISGVNEQPEGPFRIQIDSQMQEGASLEETGVVKLQDSLPVLSKVKKEPVSMTDIINTENDLGEEPRASVSFTTSEQSEATKSKVSKDSQSERIPPASLNSQPSNRESPINPSFSSSSLTEVTYSEQSNDIKLPCKVPSRVYSKTCVTRASTITEAKQESKSSAVESASRLNCSSFSDKSNTEVNQMMILSEEDNLMETEEQETSGCSKDCKCNDCDSKQKILLNRPGSTVRRTYSGPIRRQVVRTKDGGKRTFMILNKNSLKTLQAKGVIQQLKQNTVASKSQNTSKQVSAKTLLPSMQEDIEKIQYKAVIPSLISATDLDSRAVAKKTKELDHSSSLATIDLPAPPASDGPEAGETPVVVTWSTTNVTDTPSITFTIQLPAKVNEGLSPQKSALGSGLRQIVTPPVFIQTSSTNQTMTSGSMNHQLSLTNQLKHVSHTYGKKSTMASMTASAAGLTYTSVATSNPSVSFSQLTPTCTSTLKPESKWNASQPPLEDMEASCDSPPPGPSSPVEFSEEGSAQSKGDAVGLSEEVLSGPCKIRKGLKIFKYNVKGNESAQTSMKNVRWIALPTMPVSTSASGKSPMPANVRKQNISPVHANSVSLQVPTHSTPVIPVAKDTFKDSSKSYETTKKGLKERYKRLLNKHRQRYYLLLKKYRNLEKKYHVVEDAGSREQVVRDARKYLSDEHLLFMESQMFLRNRTGKGNRFSKKFIRLMIKLYERSAAGYRYLRSIFTIPSVKTVQKWQNRLFDLLDESDKDPLDVTGNANPLEAAEAHTVEAEDFMNQQVPEATTSSGKDADRHFQASTTLFRSVDALGRPDTDGSSCGSGSEDSDGVDEEDLDEEEEEEDEEEYEAGDMQPGHHTGKNIYQTSETRPADEITIAWGEPWSSVMN